MRIIGGKKARTQFRLFILVAAVLLLAPGCGSKEPAQPGRKHPHFSPAVTATVKYVIDGDTLVTEDGEHIRFLGIDSPEIWKKKGDSPDEPWGRDASNYVKLLLPSGTDIGLEFEAGAKKGAYGRKLAYVIVDDELINGLLLKEGYAEYKDFGNVLKHGDYLKDMARKARVHGQGIWEGKGRMPPPKYYVASKNGKYYHAPDSEIAAKIKKKNRLRVTKEEAERLGLKPAQTR